MKNRTICGARRRLLRASLLTLAAASLSLAVPAFGQTTATAEGTGSGALLVLVRHAEKAGEHGNVDLSPPGLERAAALAAQVAKVSAGRRLRAVVVTQTCRTAQTAAPTARARGLPLTVQPLPGGSLDDCDPPVTDLAVETLAIPPDDEAGLAAAVAERAGDDGAVLVVGHSNTIPGLVRELTGVVLCPDPFPFDTQGRCWVPNDDYHHLFLLRRRAPESGGEGVGWELERTGYGARPDGGAAAGTAEPASPSKRHDVAAAQRLQREAAAAYRAGDLAAFTDLTEQALAANPASQATRYNLACGYARTGREDDAMRLLAGLAAARIDFRMADDPDLASLRERPDFQALVAELKADLVPVSSSTEVRTFEQLGLIPEGIAVDAASGRTFFGSMRTGEVYAVAADGGLSRFAELRHDGRRLAAIGMTVDAPRGLLWVAGAVFGMMEGFDPQEPGLGGVFAFDLESGEEKGHHVVTGEGAGFNDLVVAPDGAVYLTGQGVSRLAPDAGPAAVPEALPFAAELVGSNGITLTPDGGVLYVSVYPVGIARVDLADGTWSYLEEPADAPLYGIDGLYWTRGGLVGIQNGLRPWRLVRMDLDETGTVVTGVRWIEFANESVTPTTGAVVGDEVFYVGQGAAPEVAPSQFPAALAGEVGPVVILRAPLR